MAPVSTKSKISGAGQRFFVFGGVILAFARTFFEKNE